MDLSQEDRVDTEKFNGIIWERLMGTKLYPPTHSGADLRHSEIPQAEDRQITTKAGSD